VFEILGMVFLGNPPSRILLDLFSLRIERSRYFELPWGAFPKCDISSADETAS
jgi:hypothetical protein